MKSTVSLKLYPTLALLKTYLKSWVSGPTQIQRVSGLTQWQSFASHIEARTSGLNKFCTCE